MTTLRNKRKNILFIGAGASFGARIAQAIQPPLGRDLMAFLKRYTKEIGELRPGRTAEILQSQGLLLEAYEILNRNSNEDNFESLLPKLNREDRETIHRSVQILFSDLSEGDSEVDLGFREQTDLYDSLIGRLNLKDGDWIVVSLNYDLLFEDALHRSKIPFHYPHVHFGIDPETRNGLPIYKPHGSINFFAQPDHQFGYGGSGVPGKPTTHTRNSAGEFFPQFPLVYAGLRGAKNVLYHAFGRMIYPVIANFTRGKEADFNGLDLRKIREEVLSICSADDTLLLIGVNPPVEGEDPFCDKFFRIHFRRVIYVDVNAKSADLLKESFPKAEVFLKGFAGYLDLESLM